jgi:hypothetical protein
MEVFWLMSWWKMRPDCYVFNIRDGTTEDCFLVGKDGVLRSRVITANGVEVTVANTFVSKDPAEMKRLRMQWEAAQVKLQKENQN